MNTNAVPLKQGTIRGKFYRRLFILFAAMLVLSTGYMLYSQRTMVENLVTSQTTQLADAYFDSINTLMLTGGMANKAIPRDKLLSKPEIRDARIVRGEATNKMYGAGNEDNKVKDEWDEKGLAGETVKAIRETPEGRVLTVVLPMKAISDHQGVNCLSCHPVTEGEVLGAVRLDYSMEAVDATITRDLIANAAINAVFIIIGLFVIGILLSKIVTSPLSKLGSMMHALAEGHADMDKRLEVQSNDEIGQLAGYFNQTMDKFTAIIEDTRQQHDVALRLQTALDCVSTNVMVADGDYNIIYLNDSVKKMFAEASEDLRTTLPDFDANNLIGQNIDAFHTSPPHQRSLLENLSGTYESEVSVAGRTFRIIANPVVSENRGRLGSVVEWDDITEQLKAADEERERLEAERLVAAKNQRIRTALDTVSSGVMLADPDCQIIYMNDAVQQLFRDAEADLRQELEGFSADKLMGSCVDVFGQDAKHKLQLNNLQSTYKNEISIGDRTLNVIANPVMDDNDNCLGTAIEWADRTVEVAIEQDIDGIVAGAAKGDLGRRIDLQGKTGFFLNLGQSVNNLLGSIEAVFEDIAGVMSKMSTGDMNQSIARDYQGAFGRVQDDVNNTLKQLKNISTNLSQSTDSIQMTAGEISSGNTNLSERTEQQASALEETASSMEELTATVRNNANSAQQANTLADNNRNVAEKGGEVISNAIQAMNDIRSASDQISEIVGVIDEIAFQTNLLALNASVEAARAGDNGRGFAVVAMEVRKLAGRSATAAKEIKELIQDSTRKVSTGAKLVNASGETLEEIASGVSKVSNIIAGIASASAEQASAIDQINHAITGLDETTQQNAALAEQTSAASSSMSHEADNMQRLVAFFKVGKGATAPTKTAAPAAASEQQAKPKTAQRLKRPPSRNLNNNPAKTDEDWQEF